MKLLIKNGRVIDPAGASDSVRDVLVNGTVIEKIACGIPANGSQVIDAAGMIVMPGCVDMHVHLREPGREDKETIASGTAAALKGGITSVVAMPNTSPAIDSPAQVQLVKELVARTAQANVYIAGAITLGRLGKELADFGHMKKEGIVAVTDDGSSVDCPDLMLRAFRQARQARLPVLCHCEDKELSAQGVINLGSMSTRLGLRGISKESEYKRIKRDIDLAAKARGHVHICHVSCAESVEVIAAAKKKGVAVTAETAPHYFSLNEEALLEYDTNVKMNPPLRGKADVAAIIDGLRSGVIDAIASDHAPHTINEKDIEFDRAEFGVIGLETELAAAITFLVQPGVLSWLELAKKMSLHPAKILGLEKGALAKGKDADLVIIDHQKQWQVRKEDLRSRSKNSAYLGRTLTGVVAATVLAGKVVYKA